MGPCRGLLPAVFFTPDFAFFRLFVLVLRLSYRFCQSFLFHLFLSSVVHLFAELPLFITFSWQVGGHGILSTGNVLFFPTGFFAQAGRFVSDRGHSTTRLSFGDGLIPPAFTFFFCCFVGISWK